VDCRIDDLNQKPLRATGAAIMSALAAANRYFDAWNARNSRAIVSSLTDQGTYCDPLTAGPISGNAIMAYVEALWAAFPNLSFELRSVVETGSDRVAAEWTMRGTNKGSFRGLPPTGKKVEVVGSDFINTGGDRIKSVTGYFDSGEVPRQLGLQIVVQPQQIGPFSFGISTAVQSGRRDAPGAFSITQLQAIDEDAALKIREYSRQILSEMLSETGFIGSTTATIGPRMLTVSAWTDPEAPASFMRNSTHAQAMRTFYGGTLAESAYTSVWSPVRVNSYYVRCRSCGKMQGAGGTAPMCVCGSQLPDHPAYW
jgi:steroid delta-isomerase-like uncharacterized protein